VSSEELCILASWFLSLMSKNSVFRGVKPKKISSQPGRDLLKSVLEVRNFLFKVSGWKVSMWKEKS